MIKIGTKIKLRPNMLYKDDPEKSENVGYGENEFGKYQQLQILDLNKSADGKNKTGFIYVRIFSELPMLPDDEVVVKDILFIQRKRNIVVVGIKIEENTPYSIPEPEPNEDATFDF
ncbi:MULTISPECIES: hypothetical protein [Bacillota]|jgi:hypothetical protein|uniref:Uncharacterized protein n=1 Tax=[Eubacterium] hominis TaxID=2764325 RepID=A0A7G9GLU9_9FIRM|nr:MULTISPECIES: hypothetical protein [Bacillota]QNM11781.1 hypothetical protein H9Q80_16270 [[Eubacterium] hominis]RGB56002.1 hypothetical protein DW271_07255 [Absiella sp. AM22-9]RGB61763.1 hypothetical protein DW120_05300 [Absiella sp. AM10-20]RGB70416.1 hypothetical protein DW113_01415 [Absiella sp. AM09-45]RGB78652.1 hypothetical protein DW114_02400 [Absiella sp. AM09-50]